jgi:hypothetical protein
MEFTQYIAKQMEQGHHVQSLNNILIDLGPIFQQSYICNKNQVLVILLVMSNNVLEQVGYFYISPGVQY